MVPSKETGGGGVLGFNASATARVIYRGVDYDDGMSVSLVEETGAPGRNH